MSILRLAALNVLVLIITDCMGLSPLYGQPPAPPKMIEIDLRFFPLHRRKIDNLYIESSPGNFSPLQLRSRIRSKKYEYEGPRRLRIFTLDQNPETDDDVYRPITSVRLPDGTDKALVFLLPPGHARGREWEDRWMIAAIDDDASAFPKGHIRVLNATGLHLEGVVGEVSLSMNFGISRPIPINRERGWTQIGFAIPVGDEKELVYGNRLQLPSRDRAILVLRPPRRRRSIQIDTYLLEDTPEVSVPEEEPQTDTASDE